MNRNRLNIIIIVVFFTIVSIPAFTFNLSRNSTSELDNRTMAPNPVYAVKHGKQVGEATNSFINDRIGFRSSFIKLNSMIDYYVFHVSPTPKVILGKDGWLFYNADEAEGSPNIEQYLHTDRYSEEQLKNISNHLIQIDQEFKIKNCEFVLYIAPNKETIYDAYMPDIYQNARRPGISSTEQLVQYIRRNTDVHVVWPYEDFINYKKEHPDTPLYFQLDTHWNALGAYIGTKALMEYLAINIPEPSEKNKMLIQPDWGDLYKMLALQGIMTPHDVECTQDGYPTEGTILENSELPGSFQYSNQNGDMRRFMMARDSFGIPMSEYIGSYFSESYIFHRDDLTKEIIDNYKPDIFVYEMAERYDENLEKLTLDNK